MPNLLKGYDTFGSFIKTQRKNKNFLYFGTKKIDRSTALDYQPSDSFPSDEISLFTRFFSTFDISKNKQLTKEYLGVIDSIRRREKQTNAILQKCHELLSAT